MKKNLIQAQKFQRRVSHFYLSISYPSIDHHYLSIADHC